MVRLPFPDLPFLTTHHLQLSMDIGFHGKYPVLCVYDERSPVEGAWRDPGALSVSVGYVTANHSVCAIIAHTQHWCGFPYVTKRGQRYGADPSEPPETTPVCYDR